MGPLFHHTFCLFIRVTLLWIVTGVLIAFKNAIVKMVYDFLREGSTSSLPSNAVFF
jgi:hypothetical protein